MVDTFNGGYTKALLDVQHFFESHSDSLSSYKLYNRKGVEAILKCILDNHTLHTNDFSRELRMLHMLSS